MVVKRLSPVKLVSCPEHLEIEIKTTIQPSFVKTFDDILRETMPLELYIFSHINNTYCTV